MTMSDRERRCRRGHLIEGKECAECHRIRARAKTAARGGKPRAGTHCQQGHEFTEDNTIITSEGRRRCRTCRRAWFAAYRRAQGIPERPVGRQDRPRTVLKAAPKAPEPPADGLPATWGQPDPERLRAERAKQRALANLRRTLKPNEIDYTAIPPIGDEEKALVARLLDRWGAHDLAEALGVAA